MSKTLSAQGICSAALRAIGAYPITETAPDGEQLREAMSWLDLILAELAGTQEILHLVPAGTVSLTLVAGQQDYSLITELGAGLPDNGIQFIRDLWLEDGNGNRSEFILLPKASFEEISDTDRSGTPEYGYFDALESYKLRTWPILPSTETSTYTLEMIVQTFAPNVSPKGVSGAVPSDSYTHDLPDAWQRYLVWRLASDIASGPVAMLPEQRIRRFQANATAAWAALDAIQNREHDTRDPIAEPWGDY